jgi:hypothetical protein
VTISENASSFDVGKELARLVAAPDLVHVLVFSDGLLINGSRLVRGLGAGLPQHVSVTGGLAGDGPNFGRTLVVSGDVLRPGMVTAVGLHGNSLRVGYGSLGGWDPFGPARLVTRSDGNVLYELDGRSALDLYKLYLGDHASDLPGSALLFPLSLKTGNGERSVVRTVLSVDDTIGSMTFAGDVPEGGSVQLMKANFDRLVDGATGAAESSRAGIGARDAELAILISCVGRRMVLDQRVEEETEAVQEVVGAGAVLSGFYSYGEIAAFVADGPCELHNQTMTVTTLNEAA